MPRFPVTRIDDAIAIDINVVCEFSILVNIVPDRIVITHHGHSMFRLIAQAGMICFPASGNPGGITAIPYKAAASVVKQPIPLRRTRQGGRTGSFSGGLYLRNCLVMDGIYLPDVVEHSPVILIIPADPADGFGSRIRAIIDGGHVSLLPDDLENSRGSNPGTPITLVHEIPGIMRRVAVFPIPSGCIPQTVYFIIKNIAHPANLLAAGKKKLVQDPGPVFLF